MPDHTSAFAPVRWIQATRDGRPLPGVWTKQLLTSDGDSLALLRLGRDATHELSGTPDDRILVLDGALALAAPEDAPQEHRTGAYRTFPATGKAILTSSTGALALLLTGTRLGDPADDVFSPEDWRPSGPGQWLRLLLPIAFDKNYDERVVGLSYFEPGSATPRHPHPTAHRFLFLDGEADDELVFPDGTRRTAHRAKGDFVDYPYPIEHQTFSRTGCTVLFLHEPLPATTG